MKSFELMTSIGLCICLFVSFIEGEEMNDKQSLRSSLINKIDDSMKLGGPKCDGSCRSGDYLQSSQLTSCYETSPTLDKFIVCYTTSSEKVSFYGPCKNVKYDSTNKRLYCPVCVSSSCPSGSYQTTCMNCDFDQTKGTMSCSCLNLYGEYRASSVATKCDDIINKEGYLSCFSYCPAYNCRPGPYLDSKECDSCVETDPSTYQGDITCFCRQSDSYKPKTTWYGPCKDLRTNYGFLTCFEPCPKNNCRAGDYLETCVSCNEYLPDFSGKVYCQCSYESNGKKLLKYASYTGSCENLQNKNGVLTCPCPSGDCQCITGDCPPGSYTSSCTRCRVNPFLGVLSCDCLKSDGTYQQTMLTSTCPSLNIGYVNENLVCQ